MNQVQNSGTAPGPSTTEQQAQQLTAVLRDAGALGSDDRVDEVAQLSGGWSRHSFTAVAGLRSGERRRFIVRVEAPGGVLQTDMGR